VSDGRMIMDELERKQTWTILRYWPRIWLIWGKPQKPSVNLLGWDLNPGTPEVLTCTGKERGAVMKTWENSDIPPDCPQRQAW